jgi:hypothetical protein
MDIVHFCSGRHAEHLAVECPEVLVRQAQIDGCFQEVALGGQVFLSALCRDQLVIDDFDPCRD